MNTETLELKVKRFEELSNLIQQPNLYDNPEAARDYL